MSSMNRSSGGAGTRPTYSMDSVWPQRLGYSAQEPLSRGALVECQLTIAHAACLSPVRGRQHRAEGHSRSGAVGIVEGGSTLSSLMVTTCAASHGPAIHITSFNRRGAMTPRLRGAGSCPRSPPACATALAHWRHIARAPPLATAPRAAATCDVRRSRPPRGRGNSRAYGALLRDRRGLRDDSGNHIRITQPVNPPTPSAPH